MRLPNASKGLETILPPSINASVSGQARARVRCGINNQLIGTGQVPEMGVTFASAEHAIITQFNVTKHVVQETFKFKVLFIKAGELEPSRYLLILDDTQLSSTRPKFYTYSVFHTLSHDSYPLRDLTAGKSRFKPISMALDA
jgi:hypothetical protein